MAERVTAMGNIQYSFPVDLDAKTPALYFDGDGNFVDNFGFFIRVETAGSIKYCPINNKSDAEAITKEIEASSKFIDPEVCRKIFALQVTSPDSRASVIYVGYGV